MVSAGSVYYYIFSGGVTGVFDIEDLVSLMKRDNAEDIFVVSVPTEIKYVDYMCFVTGKSQRHMLALAEFTRRVFKKKKHKSDSLPKIEGEKSKDWIALDLGKYSRYNITSITSSCI